MQKLSTRSRWTVGLDVSDKHSRFVVIDRRGQVVHEGEVQTTQTALTQLFAGEACRIAIETGGHSPWISRLLNDLGHDVLVANSRQVALISHNQRKTDRLDALRLARLARIDPLLLHPVSHRSRQTQEHLALLRSREQLVSARTALVNHVRAVVKTVGERLPSCSAPTFHKKVAAAIPEGLRPALEPLLATIADLTAREQAMEKQIVRLVEETYPAARALRDQVHGVGALTALAFVLTIEDPGRFARSRDVGAYLGLTRKQRDSGESTPHLHITKAGDAFLRRLMVQCAHYILGPFGHDSDLRRWGLALVARTGRKRAIVAVARKLAVLMHRLWVTAEVYEPLRHAQPGVAA